MCGTFSSYIIRTVCKIYLLSRAMVFLGGSTVYGKTFEWENFRGLYVNDHSQENVRGCPSPSRHVLHETYRIIYSIRLHGKVFTIEHKIAKSAKVFPLESFAVYGITLRTTKVDTPSELNYNAPKHKSHINN